MKNNSNTKNKFNKSSNKRNNAYKGNRNRQRKPNFKEESSSDSGYDKKPGDVNNPGYYYESQTVLDQVMNFSFNEYGNVPIVLKTDSDVPLTSYNPMVIAYYLNPCVPQTDGTVNGAGNSTLNGVTTAALRNYTFFCGSNNKTTLYPPQVVILVTEAVASMVSMGTWLSRALGIPYLYNYRNRAYPDMLYRAMGIDADDLRRNLAGYRIRFNTLLAIANRIPFPAELNVIAKAAEIYGSIYLDDDNSTLAQTYLFSPRSVWTYNEIYDTNGAGLETTYVWDGTIHTFDHYLDIFENMLSALLNSTALNAVYSDIIRLVQTDKLSKTLVFNPIPENFTVIPVYNSEIATWIHNAVIAGQALKTSAQYDPQSTGKFTNENDMASSVNANTIHYHPQFQLLTDLNEDGLIDFDHDNVSIEDKVRATRFAFRCTSMVDSGNNKVYSDDFALMDYYMTEAIIYLSSDINVPGISIGGTKFPTTLYTKAAYATLVSGITKFDWAPILYATDAQIGVSTLDSVGDLDYYTQLTYDTLVRIYDYEVIHYLQVG